MLVAPWQLLTLIADSCNESSQDGDPAAPPGYPVSKMSAVGVRLPAISWTAGRVGGLGSEIILAW